MSFYFRKFSCWPYLNQIVKFLIISFYFFLMFITFKISCLLLWLFYVYLTLETKNVETANFVPYCYARRASWSCIWEDWPHLLASRPPSLLKHPTHLCPYRTVTLAALRTVTDRLTLDSFSHRRPETQTTFRWVSFPTSPPLWITTLNCVPSATGKQGLRQAGPQREEDIDRHSPKAPCTSLPRPWTIYVHLRGPIWNNPWAPALACSTHFFGLRAPLSGSLMIPSPALSFSHTSGHESWGAHPACSLCPHISTAGQGSA